MRRKKLASQEFHFLARHFGFLSWRRICLGCFEALAFCLAHIAPLLRALLSTANALKFSRNNARFSASDGVDHIYFIIGQLPPPPSNYAASASQKIPTSTTPRIWVMRSRLGDFHSDDFSPLATMNLIYCARYSALPPSYDVPKCRQSCHITPPRRRLAVELSAPFHIAKPLSLAFATGISAFALFNAFLCFPPQRSHSTGLPQCLTYHAGRLPVLHFILWSRYENRR